MYRERLQQLEQRTSSELKLEAINSNWCRSFRTLPFYDLIKQKYCIPDRFLSLDHYSDAFPILDKQVFRDNSKLLLLGVRESDTVSTGGSSGIPVRFPLTARDRQVHFAVTHGYRVAFHIRRGRGLHCWGHSHMYSGLYARVRSQLLKKMKGFLLGLDRVNAYDTSDLNLLFCVKKIERKNISYLIGYTSFIVNLAEYICKFSLHDNVGMISSIVITSETYATYDLMIIQRAFPDATIFSEYGMAETGVIAYGAVNSGLIFDSWYGYCELSENKNIIFTSLQKMDFPYFRYDTGDLVAGDIRLNERELVFAKKINGRSQDILALRTRTGGRISISAIQIIHILKSIGSVSGVQVKEVQKGRYKVRVRNCLRDHDRKVIFNQLSEVLETEYNVELASQIELDFETEIERSLAGKVLQFVR